MATEYIDPEIKIRLKRPPRKIFHSFTAQEKRKEIFCKRILILPVLITRVPRLHLFITFLASISIAWW